MLENSKQESQEKYIVGLLCIKHWAGSVLICSEYFLLNTKFMRHDLQSKSEPTLVFKKSFAFWLGYSSTVFILKQICSQAAMKYKFSLLSCWLDTSWFSQLHLSFLPWRELRKGFFLAIACGECFKNYNEPPGYTWKSVPSEEEFLVLSTSWVPD